MLFAALLTESSAESGGDSHNRTKRDVNIVTGSF